MDQRSNILNRISYSINFKTFILLRFEILAILDYFKAAKVTINSKVAIVENLEVKIDSTDEEFHKALFQADSLLSSFNCKNLCYILT